ncbi:spike glycoprotein [Magpie-robin coronavirus HKU18]|uniref:spike glycoprotein n=1 Tax=Magpie-robin coronavirus HKU18 TaxID=1159903 RepID=UPI00025719C5|nr:spike glycoprotein [Magpie-robin coronavirus HKU18]AFD29217.1 spike glycoprotein [Magpie-robin coronavirus HKU18]
MRGAILTLILVTSVKASPLADSVLDFLTFPGAHSYLHPRRGDLGALGNRMRANIRNSQTDVCTTIQQGGFIPSTFTFPQWYVLTNGSTFLQGEYTLSQPLLANAHFCPRKNSDGYWRYSFNNSCLFPDHRCQDHWYDSQNPICLGWNNTFGLSDNIRININISHDEYQSHGGYVSLTLESGSVVNITCTNNSDPSTVTLATSLLPWARAIDQPMYCFANLTTGTASQLDFMGMLPPLVSELAFDRTGGIYINGYRYYLTSALRDVDFKLKRNDTAEYFAVTWANYTDVHLSVDAGAIEKIKYCNTPLDRLACDMNVFNLSDGVYSYTSLEKASVPETFVTLPVYSNHTYVTINTSYTVGSCVNCPPISSTIDIMHARNDTLCVNSRQFTVRLNTHHHAQYPQYFSTAFVAGTCPFTLPNINNYLTFGSVCFSTVNNGGCTIHVQKVWNHQYHTFGTIYVAYQDGNYITALPQPSTGVADISTVHLDVCTKYSIYGKTGTGVIRETNQSYTAGLYYTSSSGDLLAFKNVTTQKVYSVTPCTLASQVAVYNNSILAAFTSTANLTAIDFNYTIATPTFYYHSIGNETCEQPVITYGSIGLCPGGGLRLAHPTEDAAPILVPISTSNISIPKNFTVSIQTEYIQIEQQPVVVDCRQYVCNGNPRCLQLLQQYTSACSTIEQALSLNARLEASSIQDLLTYSPETLVLANISNFDSGDLNYNLSSLLPKELYGKSAIEDLLFNKVVTNGLGTVDQDYKACTNGMSIADLVCAQYYNGIMVLPGVAGPEKMAQYTASLTGAMVFGGITAASAIPFSLAVQSRLNYVALQTDVLQQNQQLLADSFNNAIGNITLAFKEVSEGLSQVSGAVATVANALTKVQTVVNEQGHALATLTQQLANNFQAISASISDIYNRLNQLEADAQVDRLITGRLASLNAFVTQTLSKLAEVRQQRQLATDKVNECVKSQSPRYGFCGNGTHLFSIVNAAPQGLLFFHTVLLPTQYAYVQAFSGICYNGIALALNDPTLALFKNGDKYLVSPRNMYQPRVPAQADFVYIETCTITYLNLTDLTIDVVIPDYVDVNQTVNDILSKLPNSTGPSLTIDQYNNTILNLTTEIADLNNRTQNLSDVVQNLEEYIHKLNATLVDLDWLNRVETYIKWPWWVWLLITLAIVAFVVILVTIFLCTGCCGGCFGCCGGCFGLFSHNKRNTESIPITSFKLKEW